MSKLEDLIQQCRRVWAEMKITPEIMDRMLDSFMLSNCWKGFPIDDDGIKTATVLYLEDIGEIQKDKKDE